jgi:hypothetical protein
LRYKTSRGLPESVRDDLPAGAQISDLKALTNAGNEWLQQDARETTPPGPGNRLTMMVASFLTSRAGSLRGHRIERCSNSVGWESA